jgi:Tfp pilus assembly protein PilF
VIKKQLGQRVADAWALLAKAYDMVGHEDRAREAYANATVLSPIAEISRRYAEVASLSGKYTPAAAPAE